MVYIKAILNVRELYGRCRYLKNLIEIQDPEAKDKYVKNQILSGGILETFLEE